MKINSILFSIILLTISLFAGTNFNEEKTFLPVIMYHSVYPSKNNKYVLSPDKFEQDMNYIKQHNYNSVFASEVASFLDGESDLPQNPILITFDDGYYNNLTNVLPILEKYELKAVINVVGNFCDNQDKQHEFFSNLTWKQVELMSKSPYIEFQNHSYNLHNLSGEQQGVKQCWNESEETYINRIKSDIDKCSSKLELVTNKKCKCFAYPFGIYSDDTNNILHNEGYNVLLTCNEKPNFITKGQKNAVLNRYNRSCWYTTYEFFSKVFKTEI